MPTSALFSADSTEHYEKTVAKAAALVARCAATAEHPVNPAHPNVLRRRARSVDLDAPLASLDEALAETQDLFLDHAVWFHDPRYQAHLNCPVATAAIAADVIASSVNTSVDTWDQSLGATHIETRLLEWLAGRLGLGDLADGTFTSGGTASNLHALTLARGRALAAGAAPAALRVVTSPEAHFSIAKAARTLGLGGGGVVLSPVDVRGRLDPDALARTLTALEAEGAHPIAVCATAGTTDRGAIDPLGAVADVCAEAGVWMHVDAAVGGALVTSAHHRDRLAGIERADSVTIDFHKTWYQPVAASALVVRDRRMFAHASTHAEYLNPESSRAPNLVDKSLQTSRRFDALKPWMTLRTHGAQAIGEWLDASLALTQQAYELACETPMIETFERPHTHMLLFRFIGPDPDEAALDPADAAASGTVHDAVNDAVREHLFMQGRTVIARTRAAGRTWLKLTLLNPMASTDDIRATFADVVRAGLLVQDMAEARVVNA